MPGSLKKTNTLLTGPERVGAVPWKAYGHPAHMLPPPLRVVAWPGMLVPVSQIQRAILLLAVVVCRLWTLRAP